jgi:apolipoprotein N-acyltransferase
MRTALLIIAGAFMGIPFLWSALWPLSLLGAALTYYALARTTSVRATLLGGTALGFIVNGLAYYGIFWHTLPLDWLEVFSLPVQLAIVGVSWFFTALGSAIWIGAGLALAKSFATNTWRDIPLVAGAWVFAEYAGAWWFGIQNAGPGSIVGPHFSLGYVGNLLATDAALLQLAPLGGVYILSASMFLLGGLVYFTLRSSGGERRRFLVVLACVVVLWGLTHVVLSRAKTVGGKQIRVALVTLQEAPVLEPSDDVRRQHVSRILRQIASSKERADVIVLPENAELFSHIDVPHVREFFAKNHPVVIDSNTLHQDGRLVARLEFVDMESGESLSSQKRFLLPDGEYVPYVYEIAFSVLGFGNELSRVASARTYMPGVAVGIHMQKHRFGALFCNEALSPRMYRDLAHDGAEVFVNSASHSWFNGSRTVFEQIQRAAQIRAAESRRWFVQASNMAPSYVLDSYGRIVAQSRAGAEETLTAEVYTRTTRTLYVYLGDWILLLAACGVWIGMRRRK